MSTDDERRRQETDSEEFVSSFTEPDDSYENDPDIAEQLEAMREERDEALLRADEAKGRVLRFAADMENLKSRTERELEKAKTFSISHFARDILVVSDNLARALNSATDSGSNEGQSQMDALVEGMTLTNNELNIVLEKHGIARIEALGRKFDPNSHQAMFELPTDDAEKANCVVEVVQQGFQIGNRVLRPAMVGIAKLAKQPDYEQEKPSPAGDPSRQRPFVQETSGSASNDPDGNTQPQDPMSHRLDTQV